MGRRKRTPMARQKPDFYDPKLSLECSVVLHHMNVKAHVTNHNISQKITSIVKQKRIHLTQKDKKKIFLWNLSLKQNKN